MKKKFILPFCVLLLLIILMIACINKPEQDAGKLAELHRQRIEIIMEMLKTKDSVTIGQYQEKLSLIESEYTDLKNEFEIKHSDSAGKARFEAAYLKALKRNTK